MSFRAKSENELSRLSDDNLVAYLVAARDAGQDDQVRLATGMLILRREEPLRRSVQARVGRDEDVEDLVQQVFEDTLKAKFSGEHAGQFFSLMWTIKDRRIADFYAKRERAPVFVGPDPDGNDAMNLVADHEDEITGSLSKAVIEDGLADLSDRDRMVAEMRMGGHPSREVAELVSSSGLGDGEAITSINVDTIYSRFRKALRRPLLGDGQTEIDRPPARPSGSAEAGGPA